MTRRFARHLDQQRLTAGRRRFALDLGSFGYLTKGLGYGIVGALLIAVAVGFAAFGGFCLVQARYRKV